MTPLSHSYPSEDHLPHRCRERGYCGPFRNESYYTQFPQWRGYAECIHCSGVVRVSLHAAKHLSAWLNGTTEDLPPLRISYEHLMAQLEHMAS